VPIHLSKTNLNVTHVGRDLLSCVRNNPKLNRGIYSIQLISKLLIFRQLTFIKCPQKPPVRCSLRVIYFKPPPLFRRRFFHTGNLRAVMVTYREARSLFTIRQF
jgi:hypothetical protein